MTEFEELRLDANGIAFHALAAGPAEGDLVLLLHGFPELSRSWRHQLPALAAAGYRAVAPDLRGYGRTERRGPYDLPTLTADVAGLVHALGRGRATVVGHDWGGVIAWSAAHRQPEVVERLAILNAPPLSELGLELLRNPRQLRRSRYALFFQLPRLPERVMRRDEGSAIARSLQGGSLVREAWPREELDRYRKAFLEPGAIAAALAYYRVAARHPLRERRAARRAPIAVPVLILWGVHDRFVGLETVAPRRLAPLLAAGNEPTRVLVEEAGHFVQNEAPERVNAELLGWLRRLRSS